MIEIKDLHKSYQMGSNLLHVLKGINFSVKEGEFNSVYYGANNFNFFTGGNAKVTLPYNIDWQTNNA